MSRTASRSAKPKTLAYAAVWLSLIVGILGCGASDTEETNSIVSGLTAAGPQELTTNTTATTSSATSAALVSTQASSAAKVKVDASAADPPTTESATTAPAPPSTEDLVASTTATTEVDPTEGSIRKVVVVHVTADAVAPRYAPSLDAEIITTLANPTETGGPLVFQAVDNALSSDNRWIEVYLPIRPNGSTGWVRLDVVSLHANPYRLSIDSARFTLTLFKNDSQVLSTPVGIGTGDTPTPIGQFYVSELLQPPSPDGPYGPYAFGLSGFSETLTSFGEGAGVIGVHGTNDPSSIGTSASHGCIRVANDVITDLAQLLPLGTPVVIS